MVEAIKDKKNSAALVKLEQEEIQKLAGHYDDDGFYLLDEGGFYDPEGFYYDKNGIDAVGGFYDSSGIYIAPKKQAGTLQLNDEGRSILCIKLTKEEIASKEGAYDEDGFYILTDKSYYDPLGYFFDRDGYDTVGGRYDDDGFYIQPSSSAGEAAYGEDLEEYTLDEEEEWDEDEDQPHLADSDFDRQAVIHEHIMPAQLYVKTQLEQAPKQMFYVRILNFPDLY